MSDLPFECHKCGLFEGCETPFLDADTRLYDDEYSADVMIIGEAPGSQEDRAGTPFVGESGRLLHGVIEEVGLQHYSIVITNVIKCRPPNNKTPSKTKIKCCLNVLLAEIEEYDPAIIMLLGNVPLNAVLGESGITNWRGVVVERDNRIYVPAFHPAYILRNRTVLPAMVDDFEKVYELLTGEKKTHDVSDEYEIVLVDDAKKAFDMYRMIQLCTDNLGLVGFDTETTSLRPFDNDQSIVMMSFSIDVPEKMAWAVVPNTNTTIDICIDILEDRNIPKIGHNIKFDAMSCLGLWDVWVENIRGDSMLASYMIDPLPGRHGLKMLAGKYLGMYDYDRGLNEYKQSDKEADPAKGGSYAAVPVELLADYAAKDAIATLEVHKLLYDEMTDDQRKVYSDLIIPASDVLVQMQTNGAAIDFDVVDDYIDIYSDEHYAQYVLMNKNPIVRKFISKRKAKNKKFSFNPNSNVQMADLLYGSAYFDLEPTAFTDSGAPSVAWDCVKPYVGELPFLENYRYYKLLGKMLGTYLGPAVDKWPSKSDKRVRSSYRLHGTVTGRLASRDPNLQNIPTPEKEPGTLLEVYPIKNIFTHTHDGGCLLAVDYSGMELRTMASVSGCVGMARAFEEGKDVHSIVTCALYDDISYDDFMLQRKSKDKAIASAANARRYRAKWVNWTLLFGGGEYTLHRLYGIEKAESRRLIDMYYNMFPEVLDYNASVIEFIKEHGYFDSNFGRRRYFPYINDRNKAKQSKAERSAKNFPIQSAAGDVLLAALIVIDEGMLENNLRSYMVNTVHDSVMFDVYPGELRDLAELCKDSMENICEYAVDWFPQLDFSWFTVPLKVDMEVGSHYGSLEHYEVVQ